MRPYGVSKPLAEDLHDGALEAPSNQLAELLGKYRMLIRQLAARRPSTT
jgi:hypothetical protein